MSDDPAKRLVDRVLGGDRDAYREIVSGYQHHVRAALGGYCRSAEELEDFCHAAFVNGYFKLSEYDSGRGPFLPWFLALARNVLLEELRRRSAETRRLARYVERAASAGLRYEGTDSARQALERCLAEMDAAAGAAVFWERRRFC